MEPISMIVGALVAGAAAAGRDVGGQALKDAYNGLKTLIVDRYQATRKVVQMVDDQPETPANAAALEAVLETTNAAADAELLQLAQALQAQIDALQKAKPGSTTINVTAGDGGVATGGDVHGSIYVGTPPPKQPEDKP